MLLSLLFGSFVFGQSRALVIKGKTGVYGKPSGGAKILFTLAKNARVRVDANNRRKGWRYISAKKRKGWIRDANLKVLLDEPLKRPVWLYLGRARNPEGFTAAFYLNTTQIVRNGKEISFYTKTVPDRKKPYLNFLLPQEIKRNPLNFRYNLETWEGNCSSKKMILKKIMLLWKNDSVINSSFKKSGRKVNASSDSAARAFLREACKIADRM